MGSSFYRIWHLAVATATQLVRMRILIFVLLICAVMVAAGFVFPVFSPEQQLKMLKNVSFGALQFFSLVLAIVATSLLLPRDIEDRTLYTILAKPVPRSNYLLGKLFGIWLLIGAGLIVMDGVLCAVLSLRENMVTEQTVRYLTQNGAPESEVAAEVAVIRQQGLNWNLQVGVLAVYLKAMVISSLAFMISCFASSTLFAVICTFFICILGQGQELIRDFFLDARSETLLQKLASGGLAVLLPDLRLFDVVDQVIRGVAVDGEALRWMVGGALLYIVGYTAVAHLLFVEKEL